MLGIIGAMEEEVAEILRFIDVNKETNNCGYHFYEGKIANKDVVLVQGGIGKVNATISTTLLIKDYHVDKIINIGSAGGLDLKEEIGDVVIGSEVVHHDVDVTGFSREMGEVPGMPRFFKADEKMVSIVKDILSSKEVNAHIGLIASGDQFVCREDQVSKIKKDFPDAMCSEMEAASVAQVCHVFKIPFIVTRGLSDIFNKGNNALQFDEYLKKASITSAQMCYELAEKL